MIKLYENGCFIKYIVQPKNEHANNRTAAAVESVFMANSIGHVFLPENIARYVHTLPHYFGLTLYIFLIQFHLDKTHSATATKFLLENERKRVFLINAFGFYSIYLVFKLN